MKITKSVEGIRKAIKSVANRSRTLQRDIQDVAVAVLEHIAEHGDWTLAVEAIEGISVSKGIKSAKLTQYFEAMMSATYGTYTNDKGDEVLGFVYDENKSHKDINLDMARAVNWFDFKAEPKDNSKDLEEIAEAVAKLLAKSEKAHKVSQAEATELLESVNNVVTNLLLARELKLVA